MLFVRKSHSPGRRAALGSWFHGLEDRNMTEQQEFFRPEAVEASRRRIGAPVRPVGVTSWAITAFMVLVVVVVAVFAVFAKFARIESISGSLEPVAGSSRVVAPRSAVVTQVHVVEGQVVEAGDPLFTLGSDRKSVV